MPPAARLGDHAFTANDAHGCPSCPHPATGPGTSGSPNINTNRLPAMREQDPGQHGACCGPNTWVVRRGAATVFFNKKPAARRGDPTTHCGGDGQLVQGSPNVFIGDQGGHVQETRRIWWLAFEVVDWRGRALANRRVVATGSTGVTYEGRTDGLGRVRFADVVQDDYRVEVASSDGALRTWLNRGAA